ncbi:hypothetical protein [Chloroflexus sp.]|uniref:hypothetical protein n=1 Tax=Chloroflexus sp. TaxID=1904827 RepID=UPI002612D350|nr:hypothetical protein [uncultured Chloroflexus sp.]
MNQSRSLNPSALTAPFRVLWSALRDLFDEFLLLTLANLIWAAMSVPLFSIAYVAMVSNAALPAAAAALLGVVPAAPAFAGLYALSKRISEGRASKLIDFFVGMRAYAVPAWRLYGVWMAGLALILWNLAFYINVPGILGGILIGFFLYLFMLWSALIIYAFPLMVLLDRPSLRQIGRNALILIVSRPVYTLVTMLLMGFTLLVSSVVLIVPFLLFTVSLLALWSVRATQFLIDEAQAKREAAAEAGSPPEERGRRGQVRPK